MTKAGLRAEPAGVSGCRDCSTPEGAAWLSTRSWPLGCLQRRNLQLAPRATVGPIRLRCAACAVVARRRQSV